MIETLKEPSTAMAIRILEDDAGAVLYDSVTERAFGLLFASSEDAEDFLDAAGENGITVFPWTPATDDFHTAWVRGEVTRRTEEADPS